ncbi:MAG: hypothetical protein E7483_05105 [Ruminococcaceae bacterium]|nr:hypothetical protein [Oscillospiraceae bacterium]
MHKGVCYMADKILSTHTVFMENRKELKITGVLQVIAYDEYKVVLRTDFGKMTVSGKNIVAGQMSTDSKTMELTGDINYIQYQANRGRSESGIAKLLR